MAFGNKKRAIEALLVMVAEGEGFKPPIPERGIPDFESSAIDHSANLPFAFAGAKVILFSVMAKLLG